METVPEQVHELNRLLHTVEDDHYAIIQYCDLLVALSANDDISGCLEGLNRLIWVIRRHAEKICDTHDFMGKITHRLANP